MKHHRSRHSNAGACPPGAAPENTLYFARVPPTVPCEEILALFETCGPVRHLQLYRPWCNARSSKGCGLVEYQEAQGAQAALLRLNGTTHWPNAFSPLLVEPLAPHKVHTRPHGQQRHKTSRTILQEAMPPPPPPTTSAASAAAPGTVPPTALALACDGGPSTAGGPSLARRSSNSSSSSSSSGGGGCSATGMDAPQGDKAVHDSANMPGYSAHHLFLPVVGAAVLEHPAAAACHGMRAGSRSSSASWVFPPAASSTADDTDMGCTSSANNSSSSNAFVLPVLPGAPAPLPLGSALGLPLGKGHSSNEEVYLSTWRPPTAKGPGAAGAPVTSDGAVLVGLPLVLPSVRDACMSSMGLAGGGSSSSLEMPALQDIQEQLAALRGEWGPAAPAASPGLAAAAAAAQLSAPLTVEAVGFAAPVLGLGGLTGGVSAQLVPAPTPTLPPPTLAGAPAAPLPAPATSGDAGGSAVGRVTLPCQQRVQMRVSLAQAVAVAHHAPSLAQITGASVGFATTTDGDAVLTLEGSISAVVQAQNLAMLLL